MHRLLVCLLFVSALPATPRDPVSSVNPLIGTQKSRIGYGGTMPFVSPPFAMTNWTPQTRQNKISITSYEYDDVAITGFIGTHQPAIWMGDYGYVTLVPQAGDLRTTPEDRRLAFSHSDETAHPDYYAVSLRNADGTRIRAELTATERCAFLRFRFPRAGIARVLVETSRPGVPGFATVDRKTGEITGYNPHRMDAHLGPHKLPNFKGYFVVQFRQAPQNAETYGLAKEDASRSRGAFAEFRPGELVEVRVATSFLSIDQARANLRHEIPDWNFDAVRAKLRAAWSEQLGRLELEGATDRERTRLYTALYHSPLPASLLRIWSILQCLRRSNTPRRRLHSVFDLGHIPGGKQPVDPPCAGACRWHDHCPSSKLPERRMDAEMAEPVVHEYHDWHPRRLTCRGSGPQRVPCFDRELAWRAVFKDAMVPPDGDTSRRWLDREEGMPYEARAGLTYYKQLGYIPTDKIDEAASRTLEDSYDDWCVAQIAKALGREDNYRFFLHRSLNDRNLFNPALGLMNGRTSDGCWAPIGGSQDTNENRSVAGWTEGDAWAYTWSPLHDQAGLIDLMGGKQSYAAKLDTHFSGGHNVHSNEPSHHYAYLYDFAGQPWKTQAKVRQIAAAEYGYDAGGLDGDDDCGQMSAWLLFSAMGFYPVNPASGEYMIGSPLYRRVSLKLRNGKTFQVMAENVSSKNLYIQSATLNGKPLNDPLITWEQIQSGAPLKFRMGSKPSRWGSDWQPAPIPSK